MTKHVPHERDIFSAPKYVKRGRELNALFHAIRVPDLPWPRNLFTQQPLTIEEVMAEKSAAIPRIGEVGNYCSRPGCHKLVTTNNYPGQPIRSEFGHGWQIRWYCSYACQQGVLRCSAG